MYAVIHELHWYVAQQMGAHPRNAANRSNKAGSAMTAGRGKAVERFVGVQPRVMWGTC